MDLDEIEAMVAALFDPVDLHELLYGRSGSTYQGLLGHRQTGHTPHLGFRTAS
ncbi:hypothetical protein BV96_01239 [Sphingomonas paucimobilis]|nr:hypothetical protein BV96_01239 [Sphingomonas paucimobilis]